MSPFVNRSTQQFSQCSLEQMAPEVAAATCLTDLPEGDASVQRLSGPTSIVTARPFDVRFVVDFKGPASALSPRMTVTVNNLTMESYTTSSAANCQATATTGFSCTFSVGANGDRAEFGARLVASQPGPSSVDVEVAALNDYHTANNRYRFDFDAVADARFVLQSVAAPVAVKPGQNFDVDWVVVNTGKIAATNVRAELAVTSFLSFVSLQAPNGTTCSPNPAFYNWLCPIGTLGPGAALPLKLKLRPDVPQLDPGSTAGGVVFLRLVAAEPLFDYENTWQAGTTITPKISDLYVDLTAPGSAEPNSKITLTMKVGNRGPDAAINAKAFLRTWSGRGLTFDSVASSRGSCVISAINGVECPFGAVANGETIDVTVQATVLPEGDQSLQATVGEPRSFDPATTNNERLMDLRVTSAPPPTPTPTPTPTPSPAPSPAPAPAASGGGGGGGAAFDLFGLLVLVSAIARRDPRRFKVFESLRR